ncbi:MAG: hypothetical protein R2720_05070 [Candidatus Nanopelagicales bacterium]
MNSQTERTRLAWRRTILTVLVVGGLGSVHLAVAGLLHLAVAVGVVALIGCVPAAYRLNTLRQAHPMATWEPLFLTTVGCLLALTVLVNP